MSQQEMIVIISGNTGYKITLDPGSFIFDKRKVNLDAESQEAAQEPSGQISGEAWDLHRKQGMKVRNENDVKVNRQEMQNSSFGIPLLPFLNNAAPDESARSIVFSGENGELAEYPIEEARQAILKFSEKGKPLNETGPVHVLMPGADKPVTHVVEIVVI
ncbi:hypothetical protein CR205_04605 [Alteribacter lacisalsi]|uniref:Peptidyl-prolyl cis-trans isomerase n=1 Tax=Alteribacter lacisalsi TaxID=2045244 RepID=A0A2W0HLY6_9BACI|nr:peptidyl-prolyl cis-trans isomerase [Alteribacter lacisalsi]PYZ97879.1 hypothetical protein CR205_04605 [Alteribacter lacisalsi]